MERLTCLLLESSGEPVEVQVNGVPVASLPAGGGRACVAVNEYLVTGKNRVSLHVAPPPPGQGAHDSDPQTEPQLAEQATWARARLLLQRAGRSAGDASAHVLCELQWAVDGGTSFDAPAKVERDADLPVGFRRWRWLDAPVVNVGPNEQRTVLAFVQRLAFDLARGHADSLIAASQLRFEELAHAYQWPVEQPALRMRERLQGLHEAKAKGPVPPKAADLLLRPVAGGRLLECLTPHGTPILAHKSEADGQAVHAWPLRIALAEGKVYVLR